VRFPCSVGGVVYPTVEKLRFALSAEFGILTPSFIHFVPDGDEVLLLHRGRLLRRAEFRPGVLVAETS